MKNTIFTGAGVDYYTDAGGRFCRLCRSGKEH